MDKNRSLLASAGLLALAAWSGPASSQDAREASHTASPAVGRSISTMKDDLAGRSPDIRWPDGFTPDQADLFAHNQLRIDAPCGRVWGLLVCAVQWPDWYPNAKDVRLVDGGTELKAGSVFRWSTFSLPLESRVAEFERDSRLAWCGYTPGQAPSFYLKQDGDGCLATTDEVGKGAGVAEFRRADEGRMHHGHQLWLDTVKWRSEERQ